MKVSTKTIYRCDICGHESEWIKGQWLCICYPFGKGYSGWEHDFHVCSDKCDRKISAMTKKERQELYQKITK